MRKIYIAGFCRIIFAFIFSSSFTSLVAQVDIPIGTGTSGNANTTYPCPIQDYYEGSRMQFLYRASELNAAGMTTGAINAIKFNVISLATTTINPPLFAMEKMTIKIAALPVNTLSDASWEPVTNIVYGPVDYTAVTGVNTFVFNTPFFWNGADNIVIEICNGDPSNTAGDPQYTGNPVIPWTTGLSFNGSHTYRVDGNGNLCGTTTTTNTGDMTTRPNITFNWTSSGPCTSPPTPGTATVSPGSVCGGTPITLNLNGVSFGSGQTYQWETASSAAGPYTPVGTSSASPYYTSTAPTVSTWYRAAVTCSGNTAYSTPVELVVNASTPVPVITATPDGAVCSGTPVTLSTPACSACTYSWSTGATTNSITVNSTGLYTVLVGNSCGAAAVSKEVNVSPGPSLSISAGTALCLGSSTQLEANGASTYSWSPATGLNTTTGATVTASPAVTTTYTVTGSIGSCTQSLSVTITVNTVPAAPTVTASGAVSFCEGGNVTLTSSASASNQWYKDGTAISGATNTTYSASASGSYTAKVTSNGCASPASNATLVTVTAIPAAPTITQAGNTLQSSAASGNQWMLNGTAIPGATGATYTPTTSGQYTVMVTANGCTSQPSPPYTFTITATSDPVLDSRITIAPNPVRNDLYIKYGGASARFTILLFNMHGALLQKGSFTSTHSIDMSRYGGGMYVIRIINDRTGEKVQRMIIKQ